MSLEAKIEALTTVMTRIAVALESRPTVEPITAVIESAIGEAIEPVVTETVTQEEKPVKRKRRTKDEIAAAKAEAESANETVWWSHEASGAVGFDTRTRFEKMLEKTPDLVEITEEVHDKRVAELEAELQSETQTSSETLSVTLDDVKEEIMKASRRDRREECRELLKEYGVSKIGALKESDWAEVIEKAKAL